MDILGTSALLEYLYTGIAGGVLIASFLCGRRVHSWQRKTLVWLFGGIVFNLFSLSFLYTAYPLIWLPAEHQLFFIAGLHIIMSVVAGMPFALIGGVHFLLEKKRVPTLWVPLVLGMSAIIAECLRSISLSTLLYAPTKSTIGLHWSAGTFGNGLSVTPLIEYAFFGGPYILTGIFVALVVACCMMSTRITCVYLAIIITGALLIHYLVPVRGPTRDVTLGIVSLVSTSDTSGLAPTEGDFANNEYFITSELMKSSTTPDMLVLPEDTRYVNHINTQTKKKLAHSSLQTIIDGDSIIYRGGVANFSYMYSTKDDLLLGRGKWFMFPFSEYLPALFVPIMRHSIESNDFDAYTRARSYTIGKKPQVFETPFGDIGTLLCSEMFSYEAIQSLRNKHADSIVLQSHLPVFHQNVWLFMQYLSITKVIAAQTRTPLVVTAYDAPSMVINPYGIITTIRPPEQSLMLVSLPKQY